MAEKIITKNKTGLVSKYSKVLSQRDDILLHHNLTPYYNVCAAFDKGDKRVAIVHATGTGKSYIAIRWINDQISGAVVHSGIKPITINANSNCKFLYIAPTRAIMHEFRENLKALNKQNLMEKIEFVTYAKLLKMLKNSDKDFNEKDLKNVTLTRPEQSRFNQYLSKFTHIVVDEFHHADENKWGQAVQIALNSNPRIQVLGMSATPIRSTGKDVAEAVFGGNVVSVITLADAINAGILPLPDYHTAIYSYDKYISNLEKRIKNNKNHKLSVELTNRVEEIKHQISDSQTAKDLIKENLKKFPNGKFIVFSDDIKSSKQNMEKITKQLDGLNISKLYLIDSSVPNVTQVLSDFKADKSNGIKIAFAVDMISEGVHINDLDGVIMMRSTQSFIVYQQQLGRALSVGKNKNPLVLDMVNNMNSNFEYTNMVNSIRSLFKGIAKNNYNTEIQNIIARLQKEDKFISALKEVEKKLDFVSWRDKLTIFEVLVNDYNVDLNKIKQKDTLSKYIPNPEIDYRIGAWLATAKALTVENDYTRALVQLGLKFEKKLDTLIDLRITQLRELAKVVNLNEIKFNEKLSDYLPKYKGSDEDIIVGNFIKGFRSGRNDNPKILEVLKELNFDLTKKIKVQTDFRIVQLRELAEVVDINKIKFLDKLSDYLPKYKNTDLDFAVGAFLKNVRYGINNNPKIVEVLKELNYTFTNKFDMLTDLRITQLRKLAKVVDLNEVKQCEKLSDYLPEYVGSDEDFGVGAFLCNVKNKNEKNSEKLLEVLKELNFSMVHRLDAQTELRITQLRQLAKVVDLNKVKNDDKLSDYLPEYKNSDEDFYIGSFLKKFKSGRNNNPRILKVLKQLNFDLSDTLYTQTELRITQLRELAKVVDLNKVSGSKKLSDYLPKYRDSEKDFNIGRFLVKARAGVKENKKILAVLKELNFSMSNKTDTDAIFRIERLKELAKVVDLNKVKKKSKLSDYLPEYKGSDEDMAVGSVLNNYKYGYSTNEKIVAFLKEQGFKFSIKTDETKPD